ncbi:MAG: flagellar hook-length control protein FliK [Gammaproteobacteria bacterium]|nr:flagellar hook-length control protein FliK [Gammaproteobacteria bacterium]
MEISNTISGVRISLEQIKSSLLDSLRAGQILHARTIAPSSEGEVRLKIGSTEVSARTPVALKADQSLQLQVVDTGKTLLLRVLGAATEGQLQAAAMRSALPRQRPLAELLQQLLPLAGVGPNSSTASSRRDGHAELPPQPERAPAQHGERIRQTLSRLLTTMGGGLPTQHAAERMRPTRLLTAAALSRSAQLPPNASLAGKSLPPFQPDRASPTTTAGTAPSPLAEDTRMLRAVERLLPVRVDTELPVTAEIVRRAIESSGLFFEPLLARGSVPENDSKRGLIELLLRLRQQLPAAPTASTAASGERASERLSLLTELIAQTEGSLARVVLNQLASLPQEEPNKQLWQLDIPLSQAKGEETVRLQIERESTTDRQEGAADRWSVKLDFDIEPIGPVRAQLTLVGEEISSRFTAGLAATADKIEKSIHLLEHALLRAGFKVVTLSAAHGEIEQQIRSGYALLDEHA